MIEYITKHCLFCGGDGCHRDLYARNFRDEDLNEAVFSARRVTEHFHYKMVRCSHTGLVFSREILPGGILEKLYAGSQVTFAGYSDIIRKDYWRPLRKFAPTGTLPGNGSAVRKRKALEIGCSSGFFLEELLAQGFAEAQGCEPSLEAKAMAAPAVRDGIHTGFFTDAAYPDGDFDLICAFQTLDHLSDPLDMLRTCFAKVKSGGLLYLIVHNVDGLQARLFGEKSPIIDVEHVYLFNPRTLGLAVERAGFRIVRGFPVSNSYPLEYWISHAPLPLKKQLLGMGRALGLAGLRAPLSLGNIGILARKSY